MQAWRVAVAEGQCVCKGQVCARERLYLSIQGLANSAAVARIHTVPDVCSDPQRQGRVKCARCPCPPSDFEAFAPVEAERVGLKFGREVRQLVRYGGPQRWVAGCVRQDRQGLQPQRHEHLGNVSIGDVVHAVPFPWTRTTIRTGGLRLRCFTQSRTVAQFAPVILAMLAYPSPCACSSRA